YELQRDDLYAGRTPRTPTDQLTVGALCNRFLYSKELLRDNGEITPRTFNDYRRCCDRIVNEFGGGRIVIDLAGDDFENLRQTIADKYGPVRLSSEIAMSKMVFRYGYE